MNISSVPTIYLREGRIYKTINKHNKKDKEMMEQTFLVPEMTVALHKPFTKTSCPLPVQVPWDRLAGDMTA